MDRQPALQQWAYPFPGNERHDPFLYYRALAKARGGHYLIGNNGLWHGGVHFDAGTATLLDQSSVRCIADGEVIAYRIDDQYPVSQYGDQQAPYSTGFVLVRHRLEMPVPQDKACTTKPALAFYSLYMHLQDWAGYQQDGAPEPAAFLAPTCYGIRPDKATDPFLGLRARAAPPGQPGHDQKIALLPKGCRVQVGPAAAPGSAWHRLIAVLDGPATTGGGWLFVPELSATEMPDIFVVGTQANDSEPTLLPGHGLNVRKAGNGRKDDPITAVLPPGCKVLLEPGDGPYRKLQRIVEGAPPGILAADIQGYLHVASLQPERTKPLLNSVHLLAEPMPIKAGELIGHLGLYQNQDEAQPSPLLHLEVFSCDDVPAFIAQCRQLAQWLPDSEKTLLKIYKGASKLIPHREGLVPDIGMPGATVGVDLTLPLSYLEGLPASHCQTTIQHQPGDRNGRTTRWWRLEDVLVDETGQLISGWLADHELLTSRHSPWEWGSFELLSKNSNRLEELAHHLDARKILSEEESNAYRCQIETAHRCCTQKYLRKILSGDIDTDKNRHLSAFLKTPTQIQLLSAAMIHAQTEWYERSAQWEELDLLMARDEKSPSWENEKFRIKQMSWWEEAKLNSSPICWHIHPLALIVNFQHPQKHPIIKINQHKTELVFLELYNGAVIDDNDYAAAAAILGCEVLSIKAVAITETGNFGSYWHNAGDDPVPTILFERHYFHRLTQGRHDRSNPHISQLSRGGYGKISEQYEKLLDAYHLNKNAALKSASWGRFQIMGNNHLAAGYQTVEDMVKDFSVSEKNQLLGFINLIKTNSKLLKSLRDKDWLTFARRYNGSQQNGYDARIKSNYDALKIQAK